MRKEINWNTVFFWSMILVLAFIICNHKTIIREGFREGEGKIKKAQTVTSAAKLGHDMSGPGLDIAFGGNVPEWKITTGKGGNLEFKRGDKTVASFGKDGTIKGNKCSCGYWNLRDSRVGIPSRGDMNLHTDGWLRMLDYESPEVSKGKHKISEYKKGGFSGKQLYYLKGGKTATKLE
jgi:hypothetical protein